MQEENENSNDQINNSKVEDNGAKLIFGNATLCAEFLRDYSGIDLLKNVSAEDITDVTERFIPMFTEERNADVVKQVRISEDEEVFIALIEHKSHVDYNVAMQILRYMVLIWEDYGKRQEKKVSGISKLKGFKYPPVFPIVYYNGEENWTADKSFASRIALSDVFLPYIPNFNYHLVSTADYENEELISKNDALSLIMIVNKIKETGALNDLVLPKEYLDSWSEKSPTDVLDVLEKVIAVLLRKQNFPEDEIQDFLSLIKERRMSDLFEGFRGINVIEERKNGEEIKLIKQISKKILKGMSAEEIAESFEEPLDYVKEIYDIAVKYAPGYDVDEIYHELVQSRNNAEAGK